MDKVFLLADDDVDDTELFCDALRVIDQSIICYCAIDGSKVFEILQNPALK